jgi:hypothetical protein
MIVSQLEWCHEKINVHNVSSRVVESHCTIVARKARSMREKVKESERLLTLRKNRREHRFPRGAAGGVMHEKSKSKGGELLGVGRHAV